MTYEGTPSQLLDGAVVEPQMLQFPSCGQRVGRDEYGDRFTSSRRTDGRVRLTRTVTDRGTVEASGRRWGRASSAERLASASAAVEAAIAKALRGSP